MSKQTWVALDKENNRLINLDHVREVRFDTERKNVCSVVWDNGSVQVITGKEGVSNLRYVFDVMFQI